MSKPRILFLDIETAPATAYVWKLFDENVGLEQLVKPSRILCWAAKWLGEKEIHFRAEWEWESLTKEEFLAPLHELMSEADAVVTYNGDKFDIPWVTGEFIEAGFTPLPPTASIDLRRTVKQFYTQSQKLAYVAPFFGVGEKIKTDFTLWRDVMDGDEAAQAKMKQYNIQDVRLLERLYKKLAPHVKNHPYLGDRGKCPTCNSKRLQARGNRRTKAFKIQRLQCQECGAWTDGAREKIK